MLADVVKAEAARSSVGLGAEPRFGRWLERAGGYVRAIDPLGLGRKLSVY